MTDENGFLSGVVYAFELKLSTAVLFIFSICMKVRPFIQKYKCMSSIFCDIFGPEPMANVFAIILIRLIKCLCISVCLGSLRITGFAIILMKTNTLLTWKMKNERARNEYSFAGPMRTNRNESVEPNQFIYAIQFELLILLTYSIIFSSVENETMEEREKSDNIKLRINDFLLSRVKHG